MTNYYADWIFNFALRLAAIVCLSTLALGLIMGVDPLTALFRSGVAFFSFLVLGWAASLLWQMPETRQVEVESDREEDPSGPTTASAAQPAMEHDE